VPWRPALAEIVKGRFSMCGFVRSRLAEPDRFTRQLPAALRLDADPMDGRYELDLVGAVV
jgi:hypothetical protein